MRTLRAIITCISLFSYACSSPSDAPSPEEPVAPPTESAEAPPAEPPVATEEKVLPPAEEGHEATDIETVGELADPTATTGQKPADSDNVPPESAFSDIPSPHSEDPPAKRKHTVVRFVKITKLNVRSGPSTKATIVGELSQGARVDAEIKGKFAKIGDGQWVMAKYLTAKAPGKSGKAKARGQKNKKKPKARKKARSAPAGDGSTDQSPAE